jgi:hypothetical protein
MDYPSLIVWAYEVGYRISKSGVYELSNCMGIRGRIWNQQIRRLCIILKLYAGYLMFRIGYSTIYLAILKFRGI